MPRRNGTVSRLEAQDIGGLVNPPPLQVQLLNRPIGHQHHREGAGSEVELVDEPSGQDLHLSHRGGSST